MRKRGYSSKQTSAVLLLVLNLVIPQLAYAVTIDELQSGWDTTNFQLTGKQQQASFEELVAAAEEFTAANPTNADGWIWSGIIKSSFAGSKGGLGALSLAKQARADFEQSLKLDESAMLGSAHTSLGTLYANVPGWPLGFGNDEKAEEYLLQGLALNPAGIDSNYFYAQYLGDHQRADEARKYYEAALQAAPRPGRAVADDGRHAEAREALARLN